MCVRSKLCENCHKAQRKHKKRERKLMWYVADKKNIFEVREKGNACNRVMKMLPVRRQKRCSRLLIRLARWGDSVARVRPAGRCVCAHHHLPHDTNAGRIPPSTPAECRPQHAAPISCIPHPHVLPSLPHSLGASLNAFLTRAAPNTPSPSLITVKHKTVEQ